VTTLDLPEDERIEERCGSCTRCLDACPTGAFVRPFVLDARRCVSYLTIESREAAPPALRGAMGQHLFGCDDCQTVCPFNRAEVVAPAAQFAPLSRWSERTLEDLVGLEQGSAAWDAVAEGSPVKRATAGGAAASAAVVLGNVGDESALPALRAAATAHSEARVRDAASWAIGEIEGRTARR
jgi:epoxyqueuosine reductase